MTREELRNIDVLIAERIGWTQVRREYDDLRKWRGDVYGLSPVGNFEKIPAFSSDLAASWNLIERMRLHLKYPQELAITASANAVSITVEGRSRIESGLPLAAAFLFLEMSARKDLSVDLTVAPFLGAIDAREAAGIAAAAKDHA